MFGINSTEMMMVFVIALLLYGKRLPEVARSFGKGIMEFKKGLYNIQDEVMSASKSQPPVSHSRPIPSESREEAIAPKFEPPKLEPTDAASQNIV
jgi:sec-independent protein translocase protein TatA